MNRNLSAALVVILALLICELSTPAYTRQFADKAKSVKLRWKDGVVPISISNSMLTVGPNIRPDSDVVGALRRSLDSWERVTDIKFIEIASDKLSVSPGGKYGDGVNLITVAQTPENLLLFGDDQDGVSARTRVFYNGKGFITEADIVLNPYQEFSTDGSIGTFDLESTLTHEIGHFLGLEHSSVIGSTMQASQGKNGVYNLPGFSPRTLAEDDIAGIRSIYGAGADSESCCGSVSGTVLLPDGKPAADFNVWIEERSGRNVVAEVKTDTAGKFLIEGLPKGGFAIGVRDSASRGAMGSLAAQELGSIEVAAERRVRFSGTLANLKRENQIQYVGFNGQLSNLAVPLNAGRTFVIFAGGKNLDADGVGIGFNSRYFKVTPNSIVKQDYGNGISVVSCEITVSNVAPLGDYSFFVTDNGTVGDISIGSLSVEDQTNPWSSFLAAADE